MAVVSLKFLFLTSAVLSCCIASIVAWRLSLLQGYVEESIDRSDVDLSNAISQDLSLAGSIVDNEMARIVLYTKQTVESTRARLALLGPSSVLTSADVVANFNRSLFENWAARTFVPGDCYGWGMTFLFPWGATTNWTHAQLLTAYSDPNRRGTYTPIHGWTDPGTGLVQAYALVRDPLTQSIVLGDWQYEWNWLDVASSTVPYGELVDILPWASADGVALWFVRHSIAIREYNVQIVPETYASLLDWNKLMVARVKTPNALFFVFDNKRQLMTTNVAEETARLQNCSLPPMDCISFHLDGQHPISFIRDVASVAVEPLVAALKQRAPGTAASPPPPQKAVLTIQGTEYMVELRLVQSISIAEIYMIMLAPRHKAYSSDRSTVNLLMALVILVSFFSTVVFGLAVYLSFLRPIDQLTDRMGRVARLDFEDMTATAEPRGISEMSRLEKGYFDMAMQLQRIKSFVPQSVLAGLMATHADGDEEDDDDASRRISTVDNALHRASGGGSRSESSAGSPRLTNRNRSNANSFKESSLRDGHVSAESASATPSAVLNISADVVQRRVTVVVFNLQGFHALRDSVARLCSVQAQYLAIVQVAAKECKGVVDYFQGDHVTVTFNAVHNAAAHQRRATAMAWAVHKEVGRTPALPRVSGGISSGMCTVGNMGTEAMRRFCIVGPCVAEAAVLERLSRQYTGATPLLLTQAMIEEVSLEYLVQCVDVLDAAVLSMNVVHSSFPSTVLAAPSNDGKKSVIAVASVEGPKSMETNEWMYQLEEGVAADPFFALNSCFLTVAHGDTNGARELLLQQRISEKAVVCGSDNDNNSNSNLRAISVAARTARLVLLTDTGNSAA